MVKVLVSALGQLGQNLGHLVSKRARHHHAILRASEFRSRDHFHGLRDLLRVLHRLDAPADVQKIRHRRYAVGAAALVAGFAGAAANSVVVDDDWLAQSALKSSSTCFSPALMSSVIAFCSRRSESKPGREFSTNFNRLVSNRRMSSIATSSV